MSLIVYSPRALEIMEKVAQMFSRIENKNLGKISYCTLSPAFTKGELGKLRRIKSVSKQRTLKIRFILPSFKDCFLSNPLKILSFLLGHEGKGSILSSLIEKGLASELASSCSNVEDYFSQANIRVVLTKKGINNYQKVVLILFQYIGMLKRTPLPRRLFDEIKNVKKMKFEFRSRQRGLQKVKELVRVFPHYPVEFVNNFHFLLETFEPKKFSQMLDHLTPENMIVELLNHELESLPLRDSFYDTQFSNQPLDPKFIEEIHQALSKNPFFLGLPKIIKKKLITLLL